MIAHNIISMVYSGRQAKRTGLPYMRHIDQGLVLLREVFRLREEALEAWCLHPLFQLDEHFVRIAEGRLDDLLTEIPTSTVALAMEYRASANSYLTQDERRGLHSRTPIISPLNSVKTMLIVDKVQNYRDAKKYLFPHVTKEEQELLERYFGRWLEELHVSKSTLTVLNRELSRYERAQR